MRKFSGCLQRHKITHCICKAKTKDELLQKQYQKCIRFKQELLNVSYEGFLLEQHVILTQIWRNISLLRSCIQFIITFSNTVWLINLQPSSEVFKLVQKCLMFAFWAYNSFVIRTFCICISVEGKELLSGLLPQWCSLLLWIFLWVFSVLYKLEKMLFKLKLIMFFWLLLALFLQGLHNTILLIPSLRELFHCVR